MKITFQGVVDTLACTSLTAVLVYWNHYLYPSKWLLVDVVVSIAVIWTMVEVFVKAYLYDQPKEDVEK